MIQTVIFLFTTILYVNAIITNSEISTWLSYPIHDINDEMVIEILDEARNNISNNGLFQIPSMLSPKGLEMFSSIMYNNDDNEIPLRSYFRKTRMNILQKSESDYEDQTVPNFQQTSIYPHTDNNPFNPLEQFMNFSMNVINHIDLTPEFDALYTYPPLLQFLRHVVTTTNLSKDSSFNNLHLRKDFNGSVYGFFGNENDEDLWHLDESPFTCIWMIRKPQSGGNLHYLYVGGKSDDKSLENDTKEMIARILVDYVKDQVLSYDIPQYIDINGDNIPIGIVDANPGDMYCFHGNVVLHKSSIIKGDDPRIIIATAFADTIDFENTNLVQDEFFCESNSKK